MGKVNSRKQSIFVDMNGRLGNQLFQYAFARKLSIRNNYDLVFDFKNVLNKGIELKCTDSFVDSLRFFNVVSYNRVFESGFEIKKHGTFRQKTLLKFYYFFRKIYLHFNLNKSLQKYQYRMQKHGIYKEDEFKIAFFDKYKGDIFVKGYFENPLYFEDIRDVLLREFTPIAPRLEKNKNLYDLIENNESVCVSFRVWNEIANNKALFDDRNVCSVDYYMSAIKKMKEVHSNAVFIIFSNDINWVRNNISFDENVFFEDGTDEVYEKLRLMSLCKHFIMSTSTFCWWAQYLSTNADKTVISPDKWCNSDPTSKLLLDDWIKIKTK